MNRTRRRVARHTVLPLATIAIGLSLFAVWLGHRERDTTSPATPHSSALPATDAAPPSAHPAASRPPDLSAIAAPGTSATMAPPPTAPTHQPTTAPFIDPAAEAFRAELDGYVRDGREPEFIAAVAAALSRADHSPTTRWNIYVLRFIGTDKAESVLHEALGIEIDKSMPDTDDRLSVVASALDALDDIVGREERLDMTGRYVTALEDAIVNARFPHVAIHAARIHLTHAENREEAERHLAALLGEDRAWILDIEDRIPAPLPETP